MPNNLKNCSSHFNLQSYLNPNVARLKIVFLTSWESCSRIKSTHLNTMTFLSPSPASTISCNQNHTRIINRRHHYGPSPTVSLSHNTHIYTTLIFTQNFFKNVLFKFLYTKPMYTQHCIRKKRTRHLKGAKAS